jgi:hypothetical protein
MDKHRKPLSTKKPPIPSKDHSVISAWMENSIMPGIQPLISSIDGLIHDSIPDLNYAVKWGKAYYGTSKSGWLIEIAAYHVSANIVFLNGAAFDPQPPLGTGDETRYLKLKTIDELASEQVKGFIEQANAHEGWK